MLGARVFHPLMPKGVEHVETVPAAAEGCADVFHPLMPKGVEHSEGDFLKYNFTFVFHPLMPKGVEHQASGAATIGT